MARFLSLKTYLAKWNLQSQSPHCSSTRYIVIFKISKFESKSGHCITCLRFLKNLFAVVPLRLLIIIHFAKLKCYLVEMFTLFSYGRNLFKFRSKIYRNDPLFRITYYNNLANCCIHRCFQNVPNTFRIITQKRRKRSCQAFN